MHWVTLFETLSDDKFEGNLGEDEHDFPRLLLEYSVIGGNYTSLVNDIDRLKEKAFIAEQEAGGMAPENQEKRHREGKQAIAQPE